jgi:hypothetical protein
MADTYDVLMSDGSVVEFRADQFAQTREVRSAVERGELVAEGWLALTERIESGPTPKAPSAVEEALTETVVPPDEAPQVKVFVLGRLKEGETGTKVV